MGDARRETIANDLKTFEIFLIARSVVFFHIVGLTKVIEGEFKETEGKLCETTSSKGFDIPLALERGGAIGNGLVKATEFEIDKGPVAKVKMILGTEFDGTCKESEGFKECLVKKC